MVDELEYESSLPRSIHSSGEFIEDYIDRQHALYPGGHCTPARFLIQPGFGICRQHDL